MARENRVRAIAEQLTGQTLMHQDRGGMGSHKHGVSGRPGPRPALKRFLAEFFNEEDKRRTKRRSKMYSSLREALRRFKPK
jgi:hypothetical protein